jgi:hypothetical protein
MKCFVIPVIIGATGIVTEGLKISGINTRKTFNRFSTKNICTRNIAHNKESATIRNLKPERRGSPLVQKEKYQENEKPVIREGGILTTANLANLFIVGPCHAKVTTFIQSVRSDFDDRVMAV